MSKQIFIIADQDCTNRNAVARAIGDLGYVIPVETLDELAGRWPEDAWLLVNDTEDELGDAFAALDQAGRFYPIVAYASKPATSRVVEVLGDGCAGYLEWPADPAELRRSLSALQGQQHEQIARKVRQVRARQLLSQLTTRERQVVDIVCDGASNKEVAGMLGISPRTVEIHRANILNKLGLRNAVGLVRLSMEAESGLGEQPTERQPELALAQSGMASRDLGGRHREAAPRVN